MAYPTPGTRVATPFATSVTSMQVNLPASIASGDLLIAVVHVRNAGTFTKPSGWQDLGNQAGGSSVGKITAFYKIADGTEGATATWTASTGTTAEWHVIKITGWHGTTPPEAAFSFGDYTTQPDPPNIAPSWGSEENLFLEFAGNSATAALTTGASTNYINYYQNTASSGGAQVNLASANRELTASSENPGTFANAGNIRYWAAITIVIRPAGESGPTTISVSDSGSGSEALSFLNNALLSETGIGVEVWTLYHPREYITVEELAGATEKLIEETGSGSDIISIIALISTTDSGGSVEVLNILNNLILEEGASAGDILSILNFITQSDAGSGSETSLLNILLTISEAGLGAESIRLLNQLLIADTGSGNDSILLTAILGLQEVGSGFDVVAILNYLAINEVSGGVEGVNVLNSLNVAENATSIENEAIFNTLGTVEDDGTGIDNIDKTEPGDEKSVSDTVAGSDLINILNSLGVTDLAGAVEFMGVLNELSVSEIGNISDLINILGLITKTDQAGAVESLSILNNLTINENITGSDVIDLFVTFIELKVNDSSIANEDIEIVGSALINIIETANAQDLIYILNSISKSEAGAGIEEIGIFAELFINDSAVGDDFINKLSMLEISDNATAIDIIAKYIVKIYNKKVKPFTFKNNIITKKTEIISRKISPFSKKIKPYKSID